MSEDPPFPKINLVMANPPSLWHGHAAWSWSSTIPAHYFNFWVLLSGSVTLHLRGRSYACTQPCYFLLPPGERVLAHNSGGRPIENLALHLARSSVSRAWAAEALPSTWGRPVRRFAAFVEMARACVEAGHRATAPHQDYALALAHALLRHFWVDVTVPVESPIRERMYDMAGQIRQRPETVWRIDDLARASGYSRSRFSRLFAETNGVAPRAFITRCRLERACTMLMESTMSVSEIAYALGYGDVYFFSRHFKQGLGISPLAWRRARSAGETRR